MQISLKEISGPWDAGWVLNKHTIGSVCIGHNEYGRPVYDTTRTDIGEATFKLKYRSDWTQAIPLAQSIADNICSKLDQIDLIIPMPASSSRPRQPVTEVANELGKIIQKPVFSNLLLKATNGKSLKDLNTKAEKIEAIGDSFKIQDEIKGDGPWNVLIVDDLFHTGATMETACNALKTYAKVRKVYVAALSWR